MGNSSPESIHSQVHHEVSTNKTGYQNWFTHRKVTLVKKVFRFSSIQVSSIPFNILKVIVVRRFCIVIDVGGGVPLEVSIEILNLVEVAFAGIREVP